MDLEANTWNFLKLQHLKKVEGLVLCGDIAQLTPHVRSLLTFDPKNEFGDQLGLALMARLIHQGFPQSILTTQYRMHPDISRYANERTYKGMMIDHSSTRKLILPPKLRSALREVLEVESQSDTPVNVTAINMKASKCIVEPLFLLPIRHQEHRLRYQGFEGFDRERSHR